jgi:hypothetical protein
MLQKWCRPTGPPPLLLAANKTQAQNTHAIAHVLDTVRCSLCISARPQCRWMPSFRQRWHARIGKLHVCKHLSLKSKSRKGCQNVLCRICYSNSFLACASHVAASCARHAIALVPHIWPDAEILVALLWDLFLLPV